MSVLTLLNMPNNFRFKVLKTTCNPENKTTKISRERHKGKEVNSEREVRRFCTLKGMSRIRGHTILRYLIILWAVKLLFS